MLKINTKELMDYMSNAAGRVEKDNPLVTKEGKMYVRWDKLRFEPTPSGRYRLSLLFNGMEVASEEYQFEIGNTLIFQGLEALVEMTFNE